MRFDRPGIGQLRETRDSLKLPGILALPANYNEKR